VRLAVDYFFSFIFSFELCLLELELPGKFPGK
jgi:hypothetical protein